MAIKQNVIDDFNILSGQQKAAILMLSLDEERSASIFALMDDEEIKELSVIMASLGKVNSNVVGHHHCRLPPVSLTENLLNLFPRPIQDAPRFSLSENPVPAKYILHCTAYFCSFHDLAVFPVTKVTAHTGREISVFIIYERHLFLKGFLKFFT